MKSGDSGELVLVGLVALLVIGGIWYSLFQYDLCRDMGFGFWYCVRHAGIL